MAIFWDIVAQEGVVVVLAAHTVYTFLTGNKTSSQILRLFPKFTREELVQPACSLRELGWANSS